MAQSKESPERTRRNQAFGDVVRQRRLKAGLSQETLALECDLHPTYISMLERGVRQPSLETIFRLAGCLGMRPARLVAAVEERLTGNKG